MDNKQTWDTHTIRCRIKAIVNGQAVEIESSVVRELVETSRVDLSVIIRNQMYHNLISDVLAKDGMLSSLLLLEYECPLPLFVPKEKTS